MLALALLFHLQIERALKFRGKSPASFDDVWDSLFFRSYVSGYPHWLDQYHGNAGAVVREHLMNACFGDRCNDIRALHDSIAKEYERGNELAKEAFILGAEDGHQCFYNLVEGGEPGEKATFNLHLAVRGLDSFN